MEVGVFRGYFFHSKLSTFCRAKWDKSVGQNKNRIKNYTRELASNDSLLLLFIFLCWKVFRRRGRELGLGREEIWREMHMKLRGCTSSSSSWSSFVSTCVFVASRSL